ncbi:MAG: ABC transporter permease [Actinomycetota bacterium]|nr:ABC transporter permease [Actinomycetota bacterium]
MTTATSSILELPIKREGATHWLQSYRAMLRWQLTDMRMLLPITVVVQLLSGVGLVLGFGLLISDMTANVAVYLSTGAVVVTLVIVGVIMGPQLIAQQKAAGSYDFMWSLPVPRSSAAAAWVTLNVFIAVPGMLGALGAAIWRYDVSFDVSLMVVPAIGLTLVTGTLLGYSIGHAVSKPDITQLITQLLVFVIMGLSPISYPIENLPGWLATINEFLPFYPMANVVRDSLTNGIATDVVRSYVVLGMWALASGSIAAAVLRKRK